MYGWGGLYGSRGMDGMDGMYGTVWMCSVWPQDINQSNPSNQSNQIKSRAHPKFPAVIVLFSSLLVLSRSSCAGHRLPIDFLWPLEPLPLRSIRPCCHLYACLPVCPSACCVRMEESRVINVHVHVHVHFHFHCHFPFRLRFLMLYPNKYPAVLPLFSLFLRPCTCCSAISILQRVLSVQERRLFSPFFFPGGGGGYHGPFWGSVPFALFLEASHTALSCTQRRSTF